MLVFPSVQLLDATGPIQVFATANDFAVKAGKGPPYEVRVVTQDAGIVTASLRRELFTASGEEIVACAKQRNVIAAAQRNTQAGPRLRSGQTDGGKHVRRLDGTGRAGRTRGAGKPFQI